MSYSSVSVEIKLGGSVFVKLSHIQLFFSRDFVSRRFLSPVSLAYLRWWERSSSSATSKRSIAAAYLARAGPEIRTTGTVPSNTAWSPGRTRNRARWDMPASWRASVRVVVTPASSGSPRPPSPSPPPTSFTAFVRRYCSARAVIRSTSRALLPPCPPCTATMPPIGGSEGGMGGDMVDMVAVNAESSPRISGSRGSSGRVRMCIDRDAGRMRRLPCHTGRPKISLERETRGAGGKRGR